MSRIVRFSFFFFALTSALASGTASAQHYHIQTYREQDGVASNSVYNAAQDSLGNLWFGTRNGVSVYDGVEWRRIEPDDDVMLQGDSLVDVDEEGAVWWVSERLPIRAARLVDGRWRPLPEFAVAGQFDEMGALDTWVGDDGLPRLAVATRRGHLCWWDGKEWNHVRVPAAAVPLMDLARIDNRLLLAGQQGALELDLDAPVGERQLRRVDWAVPEGPVCGLFFEPSTGQDWVVGKRWCARLQGDEVEQIYPLEGLPPTPTVRPMNICPSPEGGIYLVSRRGVFTFHPRWGFETIIPAKGVGSDGGLSVMVDREQNVWITSNRGVSKITSRRLACYNHRHGLLDDEVSAIFERSDGRMVLGHRTGLTFFGEQMRTLRFDEEMGYDGRVTDLAEDGQGRLWIAGNLMGLGVLNDREDGIEWFDRDEGSLSAVYALLFHPEYGLFVGTQDGVLRRTESGFAPVELPSRNGREVETIRRLELVSGGAIAVATRQDGLFLWRGGEVEQFPGDPVIGSDNVYTTHEREDGALWVGTNAGLFRVEGADLVRVAEPGLDIRRPVYSVLVDDEGRTWFGTDNGVTIWDGERTMRLTAKEGLLGYETNRDALVQARDGRIWIGTDSGLSVYRREYDIRRKTPPILSLTGMIVNGESRDPTEPLRCDGPLSSLTLLFRAPTFTNEPRVEFRARSSDGLPAGFPLQVRWPGILSLTNVPPGRFQIQVQARNADGLVSNEVTTPSITIVPPLRDRWYTRTVLVVVGVLLLWLIQAYLSGRRYARTLEADVRSRTRELREREAAARRESARLAGTLESISDGVVVVDDSGRIILFNHAAEIALGERERPILGLRLGDVLPARSLIDPEQAARYAQLQESPGGIRLESEQVPIRCGEEPVRWMEISAVPVGDQPGGVVFAFRNVTERLAREQEERRIQKLESLGLLAGGIAHDFNNLLTIMLGNLSLVETTLPVGPEERRQIGKIRLASERARALTLQLLTFARGAGSERKPVDLGPIIEESVSLGLSGSNVTCRPNLDADLWRVEADVDQLSQVIGNLVINGFQAMPRGGRLEVTARNEEAESEDGQPLRRVVIEVRDEGQGIPLANQARIFDPYFSTKEKGTGLGLAIAASIVEKHGGRMTVESTPGEGSAFRVILPACAGPAVASPLDRTAAASGPETPCSVLVLDDDEEIRFVLERMLHTMGHTSCSVPRGQDALARFEKQQAGGAPFQLVILDLTIPGGMGGLETLSRLRALDAGLPAIVTSGYSEDPAIVKYRDYGFNAALPKPFTEKDLRAALKTALG